MKCTATNRAGQPCKRDAIHGGNVCHTHGGAAPQVKEAARLRLLAMVYPALAVIEYTMKDKKNRPDLALSAAKDVLDRAGYKPSEKVQLAGETGGPICFKLERIGEKKNA